MGAVRAIDTIAIPNLAKSSSSVSSRGKIILKEQIQQIHQDLPKDDILRVVKDLEHQMKQASKSLEFEKAALLRDEIKELRKVLASGKELHNDIRLVNKDL